MEVTTMAKKTITYLRLKAPNDRNGNPRRVFLVYGVDKYVNLVATVDEGYAGDAEVRKRWPNAKSMGDIEVSASTYREFRNWGKLHVPS